MRSLQQGGTLLSHRHAQPIATFVAEQTNRSQAYKIQLVVREKEPGTKRTEVKQSPRPIIGSHTHRS